MTFDRRPTSKHQGACSSRFIFLLLSTSDKKDFAWNHCKESRLASSFFSYHWFLSNNPMAVRTSCPFYLALPHPRRDVVLHAWNFTPKSSIQNISDTNAAAYLKPFPECLHCRKRDLCWTFVLLNTSVWTLELSLAHKFCGQTAPLKITLPAYCTATAYFSAPWISVAESEPEVFRWNRSRIPNNTGSRSRIFLSDSDSGCPIGSFFTSHS